MRAPSKEDLAKMSAKDLMVRLCREFCYSGELPVGWLEMRERLYRLEEIEKAVKEIFSGQGCACIKDMPGDNYTCTAHQKLWEAAHK